MDNLKLSNEESIVSSEKKMIFGSFLINGIEVAINVDLVQEVINLPGSLTKMPLPTPYLEGILNFRGVIVPIINLNELLNLSESELSGQEKVAIVDCDGATIGLIFDTTNEILRVSKEDLSSVPAEHGQSKYMSECIKVKGDSRILHVLDVTGLVNVSNISDLLLKQKISSGVLTHKEFQRSMKKCISFTVGELNLCFKIKGINEVIKVDELKDSHIQSETCIGRIELRGLTIPVIDMNYLLEGKGYFGEEVSDQKIIILKDGAITIGLLVDSVENIQSYSDNDLISIPVLRDKNKDLFLGCISSEKNKDIVLLDHNIFLSNDEIIEISKGHDLLYNKDFKDEKLERKKIINQSFISFQIDQTYGFEIQDIKEIINYSLDIVPSPGSDSFIKGVLNLRGESVTVVDTRVMYSMENIEADISKAKILIFESKSKLVGLIVDSLHSIVTIDINSKIVLPKIVTRDIEARLGEDLKEVIVYNTGLDKDSVITILNINNIASRF